MVSLAQIDGLNALRSLFRFGVDPIQEMQRIHGRYGALAQLTFKTAMRKPPRRYILAVGARYNERVLSDPTTFQSIGVMLPGPRSSAQRRISRGLLGPSGPNHTHYRQMLLPPLRRAAVDGLASKIACIVDREIDAWPQKQPVDLFGLCKSVARRTSIEVLFPTDLNDCSREILHAARLIDEHIAMEAAPLVRGFPVNVPGSPYHRMLKHSEEVEAAIMAWARKDCPSPRSDNLMSLLAVRPDEDGGNAHDKALLNHLPTLFAAAFETSQTTLAWALFLLAQHPVAARRLFEELSGLDDDAPEGYAGCKYLNGVIQESLRLMPSVPTQTRRTTRDVDLVDCAAGAGTYVVLSAFLTNRNRDLFPAPATFRPERWASLKPSQYEYLAFSAGPRTCIGTWFAVSFLRIAIARIMKRFRVSIAPGARIDYQVRLTLRPGKSGLAAIIQPQDGRFVSSAVTGSIHRVVEMGARNETRPQRDAHPIWLPLCALFDPLQTLTAALAIN